jgi:outer membrane protein assembly factor BamB
MTTACPECGAPLRNRARFCPRCGHTVESDPGGSSPTASSRSIPLRTLVVTVAALSLAAALTAGVLRALPDPGSDADPSTLVPPDPLGAIHWTAGSAGTPDRPLVTDMTTARIDDDEEGQAVVIASTGGVLWGIDPDDGDLLWERRIPGGTTTMPVAVRDVVVIAEASSADGTRIVAVEATDGTTRWTRPAADEPQVAGGGATVLLREGDELHAVDVVSGSPLWSRPVEGDVVDADGRHTAVLGDPHLDDRHLVMLDTADGTELWSTPVTADSPAVEATAILGDPQTLVIGEGDGRVRGVDRPSGAERWTADTTRRGERLAVTPGGLVLMVDRGRRYTAIDVRSGTLAWSADRLIVSPERLLVGTTEAVSVTADRQITGIGLAEGASLWEARLAPVGEVEVVGDRTVLSDGDGRLVGVRTADREVTWETWLPHVGRDVLIPAEEGLVRATTSRASFTLYDPATGTVRWSQRVGTGSATPPDADDGRLVLRRALTRPDPDYPAGIAVTALDAREGTVLWEVPGVDVDVPAWLPNAFPTSVQWSATIPPVVEDGLVVEVAGGEVRGYAASDGELQWQTTAPDGRTTPPEISSGSVVVGDAAGQVVALSAATGEPLWQADVGGQVTAAPAAVGDLLVVATADGEVRGLDLASGRSSWSAEVGTPVRYQPLARDGVVIVAGREVTALSTEDGSELWRYSPETPIAGPPALGRHGFVVATTGGDVVALDPEQGTAVGRFLVAHPVGSGPVVIGERTYLLTLHGEIHAIGAREGADTDWPLPPIDRRR